MNQPNLAHFIDDIDSMGSYDEETGDNIAAWTNKYQGEQENGLNSKGEILDLNGKDKAKAIKASKKVHAPKLGQ